MMMKLLSVMPPGMPSTWFTAERLEKFWGYVKWTMAFNMPIIMICLAIIVVYNFTDEIVGIFHKKKPVEKEEDDYEVRHY